MTGGSGGRPGGRTRGLSFGSVAERYERFRLGYPAGLVDVVVDHAAVPVSSALEVGAGTGKATRLFAARGIAVTAVEPDPGMAELLARTTDGLPVEPVVTSFERFDTRDRFDLVFSAAAWHWTDPATRWARAVELVVPGGVVALFGCPAELADPDLAAAVAAVEADVLPADDGAELRSWSVEEMAAVVGLGDVVRRDLPGVTSSTRSEFLGRLGTVSAYLALTPPARAAAIDRVGAVLPDRFDVDSTVPVFLARRT